MRRSGYRAAFWLAALPVLAALFAASDTRGANRDAALALAAAKALLAAGFFLDAGAAKG